MTRAEVIGRLCKLMGEAADHVGYAYASDCFCKAGGFWDDERYGEDDYRHDGNSVEFMEKAVRAAIAAAAPRDTSVSDSSDLSRINGGRSA